MSLALDTNVLVRYLTWDDETQARASASVIEGGQIMTISNIVLCELAWVLKRAYRYNTNEIADAVRRIVTSRNVEADRVAAEAGLRMLDRGGDFADGIIEADAIRVKSRHVVTFDRNFAGLLGSERAMLLGRRQ